MRIDFANGTIEVTKTEAKKASIPGSAAYKALMEYRMENPSFKVAVLPTVTKKIGKKNTTQLNKCQQWKTVLKTNITM